MVRVRFTTVPNALQQEHSFAKKIEMSLVKKQIEVLATFIPDEVLRLNAAELQEIHHHVGVVMNVAMEGVTTLTDRYNKSRKGGIYKLTATLNGFLGSLIEVLMYHGGDVIKFSSNLALVAWKVRPDDTLYKKLHNAIVCSLALQHTLGKYNTEVNLDLQCKIVVSCGNLITMNVGNASSRYFLMVGDAINDLSAASEEGEVGDIIITAGAWTHMWSERYEFMVMPSGNVKVFNVFYKPNEVHKKRLLDASMLAVLELVQVHSRHKQSLHAEKTFDSNMTDAKINSNFIRSLPQRAEVKLAARQWTIEDLKPFIMKNVQDQVIGSQPVEYLTQMREMTIQYIQLDGFSFTGVTYLKSLTQTVLTVDEILDRYFGILIKISLRRTCLLLVAVYGINTERHGVESKNSLRAAHQIRTMMAQTNHSDGVTISITVGFVYTGVIGHPMRREYVIIGNAMTRADKMISSYDRQITCDMKTFKRSQLASFYFYLQKSSKKSEELGFIFEYKEDVIYDDSDDIQWNTIVARDNELNLIRSIINNPDEVHGLKGVCFEGKRKIGKSALLKTMISKFKENSDYSVASVELEGSSEIPYFCVRRLYRQLYDEKTKINSRKALSFLPKLPRDLLEFGMEIEYSTNDEDIALKKYRILNYFRDMVRFTATPPTIVFVDNLEDIDLESWEILEMTFAEQYLRLITTGMFEDEEKWDLKFKLSLMDDFKTVELNTIPSEDIPALACYFLDAAGISVKLVEMLIQTSEGRPGHVQCSLLRCVHKGSIEMIICKNYDKDDKYVYPSTRYTDMDLVPVIEYNESQASDNITWAAISLDLFHSFTAYEQLIIKTASALGETFIRTVLVVAMKYPPEHVLCPVLKTLFEEEVFDCGSRYISEDGMVFSNQCCKCFFDDKQTYEDMYPKYARCKIIHFKNKNLRAAAYDLLPSNQRIELHLLCTEVLENMAHVCPNCMREPTLSFFTISKFRDITDLCNPYDTTTTFGVAEPMETHNTDLIKECVRKNFIFSEGSKRSSMLSSTDLSRYNRTGKITRPVFSTKICQCREIMCRVYKDLIYHSKQAGHLGKIIFFTTKYGFFLMVGKSYGIAMEKLTQAREYCMTNAGLPTAQVTEQFRLYHINTIELALAHCCLELRMIRAARNHLVIALRQINIPSVAFTYKIYRPLLTRNYLMNAKTIHPRISESDLFQRNMAISLGYTAKLFCLEGNYKAAKFAMSYCMYIMTSLNNNIAILTDVFCTAIEIYRFFSDMHMCERLQKYALKEFQQNYTHSSTSQLFSLNSILTEVFVLHAITGEIAKSICLGFRILDIVYRVQNPLRNVRIVQWLAMLLTYNFRIHDFADVARVIKDTAVENNIVNFEYNSLILSFYLRSGIAISPIEDIVEFANRKVLTIPRPSWFENYFIACIQVYYLRLGKFQNIEEYKQKFNFDAINCRREIVASTLEFSIEAKMYILLRNIRLRNQYVEVEMKNVRLLLDLFKEQVHKLYPVWKPVYYCYQAWFLKLTGHSRFANRALKKARVISEKQGNLLYAMFARRLKHHWGGWATHMMSGPPPQFDYHNIENYTLNEWSEFLKPFPLDI